MMETNQNSTDPFEGLRFRIGLDTTSVCNLRCRQCFHTLYHSRGLPYKQVARRLDISIKTVESHVSSVLRKLQLSSRHELARWASERRIV